MRQASIHITETKLAEILKIVLNDRAPWETESDLAEIIVRKAKSHSLSHRCVIASNQQMVKKAERITATGRSEAGLFSEILTLVRRKFKHRGITVIKAGEPEWLMIKDVAGLAVQFCEEFQLPHKKGFTEYITIALSRMKNYSLNKFKPMHSAICNIYDATQEIAKDPTPSETEELYDHYNWQINERIGHSFEDHKNNPEKYVCFKRAKETASQMGMKITTYVKAQFWAMEFKSGIPDPHQLYGDLAIQRARKYCFEHNIQLKAERKVNFAKIKRDG